MPEIKVTDEKGVTHVFPDGSTPEMISKAMGVKYQGGKGASPNFTDNPKGEGLYRMGSYDYQEGNVTRPEILVPFSRVKDAINSGYKIHPDEAARYQKDVTLQGQGPTIFERGRDLFNRMTEPIPDHPVDNRTFGAGVLSLPAATANVAQIAPNVVNRTLRGLAGLPGFVGQAYDNITRGDANAALDMVDPSVMLKNSYEGMKQDTKELGPMAALGNVGGDVATMYLVGKGAEALPEVAGKVTRPISRILRKGNESFRQGAQSVLGGGERNVASEVGKTAKAQKIADTAHHEQSFGAVQETKGRELDYKQRVDAANETAATANKALDEQHLKAVQDALHETQGKELQYQRDLEKAKSESEEAYQKELDKVKEKREKAKADRKKELSDYFAKKEKIRSDHESAVSKFKTETAKQGKIEPTQTKLKDAWSNLRAGIETAREKSLEIGNKKYSGVNAALDSIEANPETTKSILLDAVESLPDQRGKVPAIVKDFDDRLNGRDVGGNQRGPMNYDELQSFYSKLGNEISKGSLNGETFHAYDLMHEAIGKEMQRIADSKGMGEALTDARGYWRRMKQAFGKPYGATDSATKTLRTTAPSVAEAEDQATRLNVLGSFDPDIPKQANHIANIQKGVDSLPDETPTRVLAQKAAEKTKPAPTPPAKPAPVPDPKPVAPKEVPQPTHVDPPDRPAPIEPKYPKQPERVPVDDRPEQKEVNTRQLRENLILDTMATWTKVTRFQMARLVAGPIGTIIAAVTGHPGFEIAGAAYTAGELSPFVIQKMMDSPGFREWITRPPADELETLQKIPEADRIKITDGLEKVATEAQKQGIKVSPALLAAIGYSARPTPPALKGSPLDDDEKKNPNKADQPPPGYVTVTKKGQMPHHIPQRNLAEAQRRGWSLVSQ